MSDRYIGEPIYYMPHKNGTQVPVVLRKPHYWFKQRTITYRTTAADFMWTLADRFLNNSLDWWLIADLNPNPAVACPDDLRWNTVLSIPVS